MTINPPVLLVIKREPDSPFVRHLAVHGRGGDGEGRGGELSQVPSQEHSSQGRRTLRSVPWGDLLVSILCSEVTVRTYQIIQAGLEVTAPFLRALKVRSTFLQGDALYLCCFPRFNRRQLPDAFSTCNFSKKLRGSCLCACVRVCVCVI